MERLTGLDAGFLYMETPTQHMHTMKIAILDPSTVPGGYSFSRVKEVLARRLHLLPPFRQRLVEVPFGLHHPLWAQDPDFDLDYHVRRAAVPSPCTMVEVDELISQVASHPLDRRHPLWEIHVVEGLHDGNVAFVTKIHHALADGVKAAELLLNVLDDSPETTEPRPPERPWRPDDIPGSAQLAVDALKAVPGQLAALPRVVGRTLGGVGAVVRRRRAGGVGAPLPFSTPKLAFNRSLTPHRWFVSTSLPLSEVRATKSRIGCTVNDVVLAVCAGALRRYLDDRGELPDQPLMAGVPVSTRSGDGAARGANSVSNLFATLPVELDDPLERVRAVHDTMKGAKEQHNLLGAEMLADWSELAPPRPYAGIMRLYSRSGLPDRIRPPINMVVSNVPGPTTPLYIAGARLVAIYSVGPILENIGLNITVWSYLDQMYFGMVACREAMPDLRTLADYLPESLTELQKAAA